MEPDPFYPILAVAHESLDAMQQAITSILELAGTDRSRAVALLDEIAGEEIYHHGRRFEYLALVDSALQRLDGGFTVTKDRPVYRATEEKPEPPAEQKIIRLADYR